VFPAMPRSAHERPHSRMKTHVTVRLTGRVYHGDDAMKVRWARGLRELYVRGEDPNWSTCSMPLEEDVVLPAAHAQQDLAQQ